MIANALPLGATSNGDIVDFELTQWMDIEIFKQKLVAQLPSDIPVYQVEEIDLKAPSATQSLEKAEYLLTVETETSATVEQWESWVEAVKASEEISWKQTTKSGKKKLVNLCDRLFDLEIKELHPNIEHRDNSVGLRYIGSCLNDGTMLRSEHLIFML